MGSNHPYSRRWNGWQTILLLIIVQLLGLTVVLCLKWLIGQPDKILVNNDKPRFKIASASLPDKESSSEKVNEKVASEEEIGNYLNGSMGWLQ